MAPWRSLTRPPGCLRYFSWPVAFFLAVAFTVLVVFAVARVAGATRGLAAPSVLPNPADRPMEATIKTILARDQRIIGVKARNAPILWLVILAGYVLFGGGWLDD